MIDFVFVYEKNNPPDRNSHGQVNYDFMITKNFITNDQYLEFINFDYQESLHNKNIINEDMKKFLFHNEHSAKKFVHRCETSISHPITYINIDNLKAYCNWLNTGSIHTLDKYPYNLSQTETPKNNQIPYWIPNYDEFYKACYYDPTIKKYRKYPNGTDCLDYYDDSSNSLTPFLLINGGMKYYTIIDSYNLDNKTMISGGSFNRHKDNAIAGIKKYTSKYYQCNYISARICKKNPKKSLKITILDTSGAGWINNRLDILDQNNNTILKNFSLKNGYGPIDMNFEVDYSDKCIQLLHYNINKTDTNHIIIYDNETKKYLFNSANMYYIPSRMQISLK